MSQSQMTPKNPEDADCKAAGKVDQMTGKVDRKRRDSTVLKGSRETPPTVNTPTIGGLGGAVLLSRSQHVHYFAAPRLVCQLQRRFSSLIGLANLRSIFQQNLNYFHFSVLDRQMQCCTPMIIFRIDFRPLSQEQ